MCPIDAFISHRSSNIRSNRLSPVIKWAGGKEAELKYILPNLPGNFNRYFEPFVGGGAVFFSLDNDEMLINDRSEELISLYNLIKCGDKEFISKLIEINHYWHLLEQIVENNSSEFLEIYRIYSIPNISILHIRDRITEFVLHHMDEFNGILSTSFHLDIDNFIYESIRNLSSKINRMRVIERKKNTLSETDILNNMESALKSAFYMHFRLLYNKFEKYNIGLSFRTAIFYFVREFCYAAMFRYNKQGEFNVPYGGIQYNRKDFYKKIQTMQSNAYKDHFNKTQIFNLDFEDFLSKTNPKTTDFIFVDPPYDSDFSTYAKNSFGRDDQIRLANCLVNTPAKFMVIIKNTKFINQLYSGKGLWKKVFDKRYMGKSVV